MDFIKRHKIPGMLVLVDCEQTFDSVSWEIFLNLRFQKRWIKTLYNNFVSRILQNGFLSESFKIERGCRQGDLLSPYNFIICAEI